MECNPEGRVSPFIEALQEAGMQINQCALHQSRIFPHQIGTKPHQRLITPQPNRREVAAALHDSKTAAGMLKLLKRPQLLIQRWGDQVHAAADAEHRHLDRGQTPLTPEQAAKAIEHHNGIQASRRLQWRQAQLRELTLQQK